MNFGDNAFGYELAVAAWCVVLVYYVLLATVVLRRGPLRVAVTRYQAPVECSPAVAAWLLERGKMPRAVAAALVSMAAKGCLTIEQSTDLVSVTEVPGAPYEKLHPEEDALGRVLFSGYDCFDFDEGSLKLKDALYAFRQAMADTGYASDGIVPFVPAWVISGAAVFMALILGMHSGQGRGTARLISYILLLIAGSLAVAMRTLPGALEKVASRMPWSTAPRRPWNGADTRPFGLLFLAFGGIGALAIFDSTPAALITAAFVVLNVFFMGTIQLRSAAGREMLRRLAEYKDFLGKVEADAIGRTNAAAKVPAKFTEQEGYAIALHVDLGWGEQMVEAIADAVESAALESEPKGRAWWD